MKLIAAVILVGGMSAVSAQVIVSGTGVFTQNFNTLVSTGSTTWIDNSTLSGWYAQRTGTGTQIVASTGSDTGGNLYSYGASAASDRALGSLGSGNAAAGSFAWGISMQNTSGDSVTIDTMSFTGEQWRNGGGAAQTVTFWYQISSSPITALTPASNAGWTAFSALDFTSPITGGTAGALNGNLTANQVALSTASLGVTLADGQYIMFRWSDPDHSGTDHGSAIDNFSVTVVPEPAALGMVLGGVGVLLSFVRRKRQTVG